ncbi:hypothetical protein [Candidatus Burkholderia verschuerenii]|uniref:hypothetical protein n=1 Tax=Candidatus Burkholderia verschuerenii TaxID=242163 RepID=UPI0012ECBC19|nr:hypothetical protein [Candidatus Burkholderia verschuerenii]
MKDFVDRAQQVAALGAVMLINLLLGAGIARQRLSWRGLSVSTIPGYMLNVVLLTSTPHRWFGHESAFDAWSLAFWLGACPLALGMLMARFDGVRKFVFNIAGLVCLATAGYLAVFSVSEKLPLAMDVAVLGGACSLVVACFYLMDLAFLFGLFFAGVDLSPSTSATRARSATRSRAISKSGSSRSKSWSSSRSSSDRSWTGSSWDSTSSSDGGSSADSSSSDSFSGGGGDSGGGGASDSW